MKYNLGKVTYDSIADNFFINVYVYITHVCLNTECISYFDLPSHPKLNLLKL